MFFNLIPLFIFFAYSLAVPFSSSPRRAPIRRSITPNARSVAPDAYIVSIKANTVDPANRGAWLNKVLNTAGVFMATEQTSSLRLEWNETIMNGIAGKFSADVLDAISLQPEVEFIEPGAFLPEV